MKMSLLAIGLLLVPIAVRAEMTEDERKLLDVLRRLRTTGYLQAQYIHSERSEDETTAAGTRNLDQFSVRRARLKFTYQMTPTSRLVLQPDFASSGVTLKDGYVELMEPWTAWRHTLTAGQFNWPFGFEVMHSSSIREMPERSLVVRTLFPGERDRGVMLSSTGPARRFHYRAAIVNGTGTTQSFDYNKRKDFVGRAGGSLGSVDVAASLYRGAELVPLTGLAGGREFDKSRAGVDLQWTTPLPGLRVRGEFISGEQPPPPGAAAAGARSTDIRGWYVYAIQKAGARHQFTLRADAYDPDTSLRGNATRTLGGSYVFAWDGNSRVMLAWEQPRRQTSDPDDDQLTLRYQYSF